MACAIDLAGFEGDDAPQLAQAAQPVCCLWPAFVQFVCRLWDI